MDGMGAKNRRKTGAKFGKAFDKRGRKCYNKQEK